MPLVAGPHERLVVKYDAWLAPFGVAAIRFGPHPHCLAAAPCDAATDVQVAAQADVRRVSDNLARTLGTAELQDLAAYLETYRIPADWMDGTLSWRAIVRGVLGIFLFAQHYQGCGGGPLYDGGATLETTVSQLPPDVQQSLERAAVDLNYDTSTLRADVSLRQILRAMGVQWGEQPIFLGSVSV